MAMASDARKLAKELLAYLGAAPGAANVLVRSNAGRPYFVVRLSRSARIPANRLPDNFHGFEVVYERRYPARPLRAQAV
jgi:hypothetical protein